MPSIDLSSLNYTVVPKGRCFFVPVNLAAQPQDIDLQQVQARGYLSRVVTVFIDNSTNQNALALTFRNSRQRIICPPESQGYFPVLAAIPTLLTVTSDTVVGTVNIELLDYDEPASVWGADSTLGSVTITGTVDTRERATSATDRSSTIAVASVSQAVMAANPNRSEAFFFNESSASMDINIFGNAAVIGGAGSITVPSMTGWSGQVTNAINVICETALSVYTAGER
jgi:hypothetical protein